MSRPNRAVLIHEMISFRTESIPSNRSRQSHLLKQRNNFYKEHQLYMISFAPDFLLSCLNSIRLKLASTCFSGLISTKQQLLLLPVTKPIGHWKHVLSLAIADRETPLIHFALMFQYNRYRTRVCGMSDKRLQKTNRLFQPYRGTMPVYPVR